ncbi:outer membrane protein [Microbulbifer hydrolyticus]|uniref:Opacity protein-like surface antigen n=1 Tax=Microbulbifer hydrolyticus TaxID=48074 RepID=A0A6P1TB72_9GAMM|nr:outer membrane beta-barrel protein [Microbulbifer hydrolyticus]MBB5210489.1 opacity protein-like surface antigen [Microbulbifer hydrolyticus]QHQ39031.1 outer membrane beta-barrel protein [Microbulbifer hydrolyticus]
MFKRTPTAVAVALALSSSAALADGFYVSGTLSYNNMDDTINDGVFTQEFITGPGTTIPAGVALPAGTDVRWKTDVDSGAGVNLALGWRAGQMRFEAEYAYASHDVDRHYGVSAAGIALGDEDAGVLVSGAPGNLGISVADLVNDGRGDFTADYLFFNAFYDFDAGWALNPYLGAGIGNAWVDVDYSPSNVSIIDDDDSVLAYQLMAGLNYQCNDQLEYFGGLRWRQTEDLEISSNLLPANFEIENESWMAEVGVRWSF